MIKWNDNLNVGVKEIDEQHLAFIGLVNELLEAMKNGKSKEVKGKILDKLIGYAFYHFTKEERILAKLHYPELEQHKKEHEAFVDKLIKFQEDLKADKFTLTFEMIKFMNNWWLSHIRKSDKKYQPYLDEYHGVKV